VHIEYSIENQRRIDILITWDKKAVIIENKLNDACDQNKQLSDYYKAIEDEDFEVLKVVYIPCYKTKKAPTNGLTKDLTAKIFNFYPEDLINWLEDSKGKDEDVNIACLNYSKLLKYINVKNQSYMNAELLQQNLNKDELKALIDASLIVNSKEWKIFVFSQLQAKLKELDSKLEIDDVKKYKSGTSYINIYYFDYKYWVSIFFHDNRFELWITDNSKEEEINPAIKELGFKHYLFDGYHYFKNEKMYIYDFPSEDNYEKMTADILYILKTSRKDENND